MRRTLSEAIAGWTSAAQAPKQSNWPGTFPEKAAVIPQTLALDVPEYGREQGAP